MSKLNPDFWEVVVETAQLEAFTTADALWHDYNASHDDREVRAEQTRETFDKVIALVQSELTPRQRQVVQLYYFAQMTQEEIAERLDLPVDKVKSILKAAQEPISLDRPIGEDDDSNLGDFIEDTSVVSPAHSAASAMLRDEVNDVLHTLTPREAKVIRLRFGLTEDGAQRTLEEVGAFFNVTRERIRQIEAKALRKLRHPTRSRRLKAYTELL